MIPFFPWIRLHRRQFRIRIQGNTRPEQPSCCRCLSRVQDKHVVSVPPNQYRLRCPAGRRPVLDEGKRYFSGSMRRTRTPRGGPPSRSSENGDQDRQEKFPVVLVPIEILKCQLTRPHDFGCTTGNGDIGRAAASREQRASHHPGYRAERPDRSRIAHRNCRSTPEAVAVRRHPPDVREIAVPFLKRRHSGKRRRRPPAAPFDTAPGP